MRFSLFLLAPTGALELMWKCLDKNMENRPTLREILSNSWLIGAKTGFEWKKTFSQYQHNQWSRRVASEAFAGKQNCSVFKLANQLRMIYVHRVVVVY